MAEHTQDEATRVAGDLTPGELEAADDLDAYLSQRMRSPKDTARFGAYRRALRRLRWIRLESPPIERTADEAQPRSVVPVNQTPSSPASPGGE